MVEYADATSRSGAVDLIRIEFLRLSSGGFTRQTTTVPGGLLGVGAMPI